MFQTPSNELILQGFSALLLFFWAWKEARKSKADVTKATTTGSANPLVNAVSMAWDRDQQERLLQMVDRMTKAQEKIAKSQEILANKQQLDMQEKIDELLERMNHMPDPRR